MGEALTRVAWSITALPTIKAPSPAGPVVSALAAASILYVIHPNPVLVLVQVLVGRASICLMYSWPSWSSASSDFRQLSATQADAAARVGAFHAPSEAKRAQLAELGILDAVRASHAFTDVRD